MLYIKVRAYDQSLNIVLIFSNLCNVLTIEFYYAMYMYTSIIKSKVFWFISVGSVSN